MHVIRVYLENRLGAKWVAECQTCTWSAKFGSWHDATVNGEHHVSSKAREEG